MKFDTQNLFLTVTDHSVSKEKFTLRHNGDLDLLATVPQPEPSELDRYYESEDYISHTDAKRSLFEKAYHFVKGIAMDRKTGLIGKLKPNKGSLLDIGAGTGDFLLAAKKSGWKVYGAEPSEKARAIANGKGVALVNETAGLSDHSFDVITMWHVLEHVYDPEQQIRELRRLLKADGVIIVAVPNFRSFDASHYREFWAAYDVPRHLWHFSRTAIWKLFAAENLRVRDVLPMKFDAYYVSLLSEKYKTGTMNPVKAAWIGFMSNLKAVKSNEYSSLIYVIGR
jgi:2-polyprenyl-3-methyl-5-hydroxy-6-metoxy-1,4-benzoquinol methylase